MSREADVVVIGAGHNGLVAGCYLARAGLDVVVVESWPEPGGCISTVELPDGRGRLERGAYVHGGIRGSGIAGELELETRYGLDFVELPELLLDPLDDGTAIAMHQSAERTATLIEPVVGARDAEAYLDFARWGTAWTDLLGQIGRGPSPGLREIAALSEAALGSEGERLMQQLFASASTVAREFFEDERLQGLVAHWGAHSQQPPDDPGTGAGALILGGWHGEPTIRPRGGSKGTPDALVRCLQAAGGELRLATPVTEVEVSGGRARAVLAGDERIVARKAVVSSIDARRLFLELIDRSEVPGRLVGEVSRIHVGDKNVAELKVDGITSSTPELPGPEGFGRTLMLSPGTLPELERAFAKIALGRLPDRPPLMIGLPSLLEDGWAPEGRQSVWVSTFIPWRLADGPWDEAALEYAADHTWDAVERALGTEVDLAERHVMSAQDWVDKTGNPYSNPNHVEMSIDQMMGMRPSPSLARYSTPIEGLYLSGAGSHPGGGVTGMPGRNAAGVVMEELGLKKKSRIGSLRSQAAMFRDALRATRELRKSA
ncbi:MAG: NAD(P)/FAD-dependent oxidoreductase [Solirubrobacterales bacterium]|nr:NAD(P)/FAD-dependent oxidoreductase [Solirubrobacterales bacterium]